MPSAGSRALWVSAATRPPCDDSLAVVRHDHRGVRDPGIGQVDRGPGRSTMYARVNVQPCELGLELPSPPGHIDWRDRSTPRRCSGPSRLYHPARDRTGSTYIAAPELDGRCFFIVHQLQLRRLEILQDGPGVAAPGRVVGGESLALLRGGSPGKPFTKQLPHDSGPGLARPLGVPVELQDCVVVECQIDPGHDTQNSTPSWLGSALEGAALAAVRPLSRISSERGDVAGVPGRCSAAVGRRELRRVLHSVLADRRARNSIDTTPNTGCRPCRSQSASGTAASRRAVCSCSPAIVSRSAPAVSPRARLARR